MFVCGTEIRIVPFSALTISRNISMFHCETIDGQPCRENRVPAICRSVFLSGEAANFFRLEFSSPVGISPNQSMYRRKA